MLDDLKKTIYALIITTYIMSQPGFGATSCGTTAIQVALGSDYAEIRKQLISLGWKALPSHPRSYEIDDTKINSDCSGSVEICNSYPEISRCSSGGYCVMIFIDKEGNQIQVMTYGQLNDYATVTNSLLFCKNS